MADTNASAGAHAPHRRRPVAVAWDRAAPDVPLRNTGIPLLGQVPWGTHICLFWETKQDLLDANIAWFKAGLAAGEYCLWSVSDPIGMEEAAATLRRAVPDFERHVKNGNIELMPAHDWYLPGGKFDPGKLIQGWHRKRYGALASGHPGLRISGNTIRELSSQWRAFCDYERTLDDSVSGHSMLVLCTYCLAASRARDVLDAARAHQFTIARRDGKWDFLEVPSLPRAREEIRVLNGEQEALPHAFPGRELLTTKEKIVLAQIVRGASSKEAARKLKISPRTVEFHRANIMRKLGVKNIAELVRVAMARS